MYLSLNGTLVAGGQLGWNEFAGLAARVGYKGVDVNLGAAMPEGVEATRALLARLQLRPGIIGLPVNIREDEAVFRDGLGKLAEAARFARAIGCPRMVTWVMSSSERPKPEQRRILKERIQACAEILRKEGIRLGLEFLGPLHLRRRFPHEFIYRMDEMLEFARECGPNLGLLLDSWHWHLAGATVEDILRAGKAGIVHVHVSDVPAGLPPEKILDSERLMPGEGAVDWVGFFGALRKIGYQDAVSPEVFGRGLKTMRPEDGARLGLSYTLDVMRKAGVA